MLPELFRGQLSAGQGPGTALPVGQQGPQDAQGGFVDARFRHLAFPHRPD